MDGWGKMGQEPIRWVHLLRSYDMSVTFLYFFEHINDLFSYHLRFSGKRQEVDTGSAAGHIGRGPGAIHAVCGACGKPSKFFSSGVDKTISLVSVQQEALILHEWMYHVVCFLP